MLWSVQAGVVPFTPTTLVKTQCRVASWTAFNICKVLKRLMQQQTACNIPVLCCTVLLCSVLQLPVSSTQSIVASIAGM